jgi:hypothetical protein
LGRRISGHLPGKGGRRSEQQNDTDKDTFAHDERSIDVKHYFGVDAAGAVLAGFFTAVAGLAALAPARIIVM